MQVHAALTVAPVVLPLRTRYRQEMNCQIVKDSIHTRPGWARTYALGLEDALVGFGTVVIGGPWTGKPTILEFYVLPDHRARLDESLGHLLVEARLPRSPHGVLRGRRDHPLLWPHAVEERARGRVIRREW